MRDWHSWEHFPNPQRLSSLQRLFRRINRYTRKNYYNRFSNLHLQFDLQGPKASLMVHLSFLPRPNHISFVKFFPHWAYPTLHCSMNHFCYGRKQWPILSSYVDLQILLYFFGSIKIIVLNSHVLMLTIAQTCSVSRSKHVLLARIISVLVKTWS